MLTGRSITVTFLKVDEGSFDVGPPMNVPTDNRNRHDGLPKQEIPLRRTIDAQESRNHPSYIISELCTSIRKASFKNSACRLRTPQLFYRIAQHRKNPVISSLCHAKDYTEGRSEDAVHSLAPNQIRCPNGLWSCIRDLVQLHMDESRPCCIHGLSLPLLFGFGLRPKSYTILTSGYSNCPIRPVLSIPESITLYQSQILHQAHLFLDPARFALCFFYIFRPHFILLFCISSSRVCFIVGLC